MNHAAFSPSVLWSLTRDAFKAWQDDYAPSMGAGIAYYTVFSIAPLLIIVIAIAGLFWGADAVSGYVYAQLAGLLGDAGAEAIEAMVASANLGGEGIIATAIGIVLLVIGATTVFAELQSDIDRIWEVPAPKSEGVLEMIRSRLLSLGLVVSIGFLMLVSLVLSAVLAAVGKWWGGAFKEFEWVAHILDFVVSLGVITVLFALMYKILPRAKVAWHDVWVGSFVTALLFSIGKLLIGLYIGKSGVASSFGTAGALAVMLVWVYYSAQIFLLGAEFTWVYAHRYGSRKGEAAESSAAKFAGTKDLDAPVPAPVAARKLPQTPRAVEALESNPVLSAVNRHPVALIGGAIVAAALLGEVAKKIGRPFGRRSKHRPFFG